MEGKEKAHIERLEVSLDQNFEEILVHEWHDLKNIAIQVEPSQDFGNRVTTYQTRISEGYHLPPERLWRVTMVFISLIAANS